MKLKIIGDDPRIGGNSKFLRDGVATIFPLDATLVCSSKPHLVQRSDYIEGVSLKSPLTREEQHRLWSSAVSLYIKKDVILIQPDPEKMDLVFRADELLQELVPRHRVGFLSAGDERVHDAIKHLGECWRITPRPISTKDIIERIRACQRTFGDRIVFYERPVTRRLLMTCQSFADLAMLSDGELREQLIRIQRESRNIEDSVIDFFIAGPTFSDELNKIKWYFIDVPSTSLRRLHAALGEQFAELVPSELRRDDPNSFEWRERMLAELFPLEEHRVWEEQRLAAEFHMHVQWLPGGRFEHGELILDPFYDSPAPKGDDDVSSLLDEIGLGLIYNYVRDYPHLEYINIGRVTESLNVARQSGRRERTILGRRGVYIVELKQAGDDQEIIKIVRLQKWDVSDRLDRGMSLLQAMIESEEYTDYVLDRRLGCRRLTMNLPTKLITGKVREVYRGKQKALHDRQIWTPYFERDYVHGIATAYVPRERFQIPEYAINFARLLGQAAAPNMIVGRCGDDGRVFFDDGDEVVLEDNKGKPNTLIVTHHTGAFAEYKKSLSEFARAYAKPVNDRVGFLSDPTAFAQAYLSAFVAGFRHIQEEYGRRRRAFDTLFNHRPCDPEGSFAYRWKCVLKRLGSTDAPALAERIQTHFKLPT